MTPEFILSPSLPALGWFARVGKGAKRVVVVHGASVETAKGFFVEGAWSGDFLAGGFPSALTFTGTGMTTTGEGLLFAAPTHTLEAMYLLQKNDEVWCANSLALLLAASDEDLDLEYLYYDLDLMSVMDGLKSYRRTLSTAGRRKIRVFYHCNILLKPDLTFSERPKRIPEPFHDYTAYYEFLTTEIDRVCRNAADPARRVKYEPLTTISSGYDSAVCAVLAKGVGCRTAVTLTHARVGFAARGDSGVDVARQLSLAVVERDPSDIRKQDLLKEADFIAVGTGGDDLPLAAFENLLPSKILFTGFHGDKIWARENDHVTNDIVRGDPSGASLENWRLKVGFLNLPVPFLGCTQHPSVHAISNSEEMRPWSVAPQEYDRPIPRRIVESAGVLRGTFALEKKAAATPYQTTGLRNPPLASVLSPAAHKSYSEFVAVRKLRPGLVASIENRAMHALYRLNLRVIHSRLRNWIKLPGCAMDRPLVPWRYSKPLSQGCYLFHWAVQRLCAEHRAALAHDLGRSPHHADA